MLLLIVVFYFFLYNAIRLIRFLISSGLYVFVLQEEKLWLNVDCRNVLVLILIVL